MSQMAHEVALHSTIDYSHLMALGRSKLNSCVLAAAVKILRDLNSLPRATAAWLTDGRGPPCAKTLRRCGMT